jgi:hypothetical protein
MTDEIKRQSSRRYIQRKFKPTTEDRCSKCNRRHHPENKLTIQHIDGNPFNNVGSPRTYAKSGGNLKYLCKDCHVMEDYDQGRWGHLGDIAGKDKGTRKVRK